MSAVATVPHRRVPLALSLRLGRILWRTLPWFAASALLLVAALTLAPEQSLKRQAIVVAAALATYAMVVALVIEVLSPNRASLRLVPLSDRPAQRLAFGFRVLVFFLLLTEVGAWLVYQNNWRPSVAALLHVLRNVVLVLVAAGLLSWSGALRAMRGQTADSLPGAIVRVLSRWIVPWALLTALFLVIARGLGYVPLARYVGQEALVSALKLVFAAMMFVYASRSIQRAVRFVRQDDSEGENSGLSPVGHSIALGIEIISTGLLRIAVILATLLWILAGWGQTPSELLGGLSAPVLGSSGVTWGQMIGGFADVGIVLLFGWLLRSVLVFFVFPRSTVDVGARYAILAVLRYTVVALAIIFGLGALGVETGSLGWFFGAAGIGLGLGLQDIIGNFFSGLIMLLQRPIRVGDIVTVGEDTGAVEDIRMKGTTLRTFDNTTVLIPNRQLLGSRIQNLTFATGHSRIRLDVGVGYNTDPEHVSRILREVARAHPLVLVEPEPGVVFQDYGASSLDFSLFCYVHEPRSRVAIASELRYALFERLQEEGIEIPFPQRVLHLKGATLPPSSSD